MSSVEKQPLPSFLQSKPIQPMIRMFNTNINGNKQCIQALTMIKGIGKRIGLAMLRRSNIDIRKRAGQLSEEEMEKLQDVISNPLKYNIPEWMLNHQNDPTDGTSKHLIGNQIDGQIKLSTEKYRKHGLVRALRALRGLKVRGQRTKSNGRGGKIVGVSRKK